MMMVMMEMRMMMMLLTNTMADRDDKMVIMKPKYKLCQNLQQQKLSDLPNFGHFATFQFTLNTLF